MLRPARLCLVLSALSLVSCSKVGSELAEAKPEPLHAEDAVVAEQPAGSCLEVAERFQQVLDQATGTCSNSTECACHNPVSAGAGCGGVTDATTAAALAEIEREFHALGCPWPRLCAPWACAPRCLSGRCSR
jgi:hypothetical protein